MAGDEIEWEASLPVYENKFFDSCKGDSDKIEDNSDKVKTIINGRDCFICAIISR